MPVTVPERKLTLQGIYVSSLIVVKTAVSRADPVMEYQRNLYEDFDLYRRDIIIPEMLIKLRQWFGRGIRREKGHGGIFPS